MFPGFGIGGAQMRFAQVANHWGDRWHHLIVAINGDLACRDRLDPGLAVTFPRMPTSPGAWHALRHARAALIDWQPDVLVTSNWGSIDWALAWHTLPTRRQGGARPLHIHTEDGFGPEESDRQLSRRVWTRRLVLRQARVVLPSRRLFDLATQIWKLPPAGLRWIPNGVDLARFARPADPPWPPGSPVIGTVATLRPEKNIARLIEAFARVVATRPARLAIVGDGPERSALQAQAAQLGLGDHIIFTGHVARTERLMGAFALFALSSDTEQMPLSVLEAMAASRAVVATDVGDIRHMVAADNLPFLTDRSAPALAAAMARLLDDPTCGSALGALNRAKAEQDYNQHAMFAAYAGLFDAASQQDRLRVV